ncbi:MAG: HAD hydrolase-like protein [Blastocatellia bacterium]|nr:HAD hydrolase-like protein [Blastocatellia bacterium]
MVHRKPAPEPLLSAIATCDAVPETSVIVGDGDTDMQAGIAAGLYTIGVTYGFRSAAQLVDAGADVLIDRMDELARVLDQNRER